MGLRATYADRLGFAGLVVVAGLCGLCLALVAGCGGEASEPTGGASTGSQIATQVTLASPVTDLDPAVELNYTYALANMYETLLKYEPSSNSYTPVLATDYSKSDDGLSWTFHIREGVKFHDGTELNAEAVKYSIERTIKLGKGASYIWAAVDKIETPEPYTVVFRLIYPAPIDLISASAYAAYILSPTAVEAHPEGWLTEGNEAGSGPYMLKSYTMESEVVMEKFPDYWRGWDGKHFDIAVVKRVTESASRRLLVEQGEADFADELTPEDFKALSDNPNLTEVVGDSFENLGLHVNTVKPPLDNVKVRQALSYAFPYGDAVTYGAGGYATQGRGIIPKGMWGHDDNLQQYTYDLEKAKQLLVEAGYPDGGFKLLMTYNSGDEAEKRIGELYSQELSSLGIELEMRGMPYEAQWALAKATNPEKRQDIYALYWWPDVCSPTSFMWSLLHSEETPFYNLSYYSNKKVDQLMEAGAGTMGVDLSKAFDQFSEAQAIAIDEAPIIYVYDRQYTFVMASSFKGYEFNPAYSRTVFFYDTYRE